MRREDVAERIADLALTNMGNPTRVVGTIRQYATDRLADRRLPAKNSTPNWIALATCSKRAALPMRPRKDPILDVMDFLVGFCSPGAKL